MRQGTDALLLTVGPATLWAETAAGLLAARGIQATVAGVRRVHPLDADALRPLIAGHPAIVTADDLLGEDAPTFGRRGRRFVLA